MSGDEMFEELGYEKLEKGNWSIGYFTNEDLILFLKEKKLVALHKNGSDSPAMPMQELKAINKKCEELGWI